MCFFLTGIDFYSDPLPLPSVTFAYKYIGNGKIDFSVSMTAFSFYYKILCNEAVDYLPITYGST